MTCTEYLWKNIQTSPKLERKQILFNNRVVYSYTHTHTHTHTHAHTHAHTNQNCAIMIMKKTIARDTKDDLPKYSIETKKLDKGVYIT